MAQGTRERHGVVGEDGYVRARMEGVERKQRRGCRGKRQSRARAAEENEEEEQQEEEEEKEETRRGREGGGSQSIDPSRRRRRSPGSPSPGFVDVGVPRYGGGGGGEGGGDGVCLPRYLREDVPRRRDSISPFVCIGDTRITCRRIRIVFHGLISMGPRDVRWGG